MTVDELNNLLTLCNCRFLINKPNYCHCNSLLSLLYQFVTISSSFTNLLFFSQIDTQPWIMHRMASPPNDWSMFYLKHLQQGGFARGNQTLVFCAMPETEALLRLLVRWWEAAGVHWAPCSGHWPSRGRPGGRVQTDVSRRHETCRQIQETRPPTPYWCPHKQCEYKAHLMLFALSHASRREDEMLM